MTFKAAPAEAVESIVAPVYNSEAFKCVAAVELDLYSEYRYENLTEGYLIIGISKIADGINYLVDTENSELRERSLNGITYYYYAERDKLYVYYLKDNLAYSIESNLQVNALFDEIINIK